ncbi:hypothetical protein ACFFU2_06990 [Halomonas alkalicola]|uniref:hypothetical protein n=1 Tax=Halomonas alkalicola TaxID=1930622 RepID=UPI0035E9A3D4
MPAQKHQYLLRGEITATAPLSVTYVGLDGRLPRTPHGEVFLNSGTLRGPLRKAALRVAKEQVNEALSLQTLYMLGEGVDTTREVNNEAGKYYDPAAEQRLRETNLILDMFGRWRLAGQLSVSPLRTAAGNVMQAGQGTRHDQFERDPSLVEWLSEEDQAALRDMMASASASMADIAPLQAEIKQLKAQYRKTDDREQKSQLWKQVERLEAEIKELRENRKGAENSIKHPIEGYEAIAPGSTLSSTLKLRNVSEASLGLLLETLIVFSRHPVIGGHQGAGGTLEARWTVYRRDAGSLQAEEIGEVALDELGIQLIGDALEAAREAFRAAIPTQDLSCYLLEQAMQKAPRGR